MNTRTDLSRPPGIEVPTKPDAVVTDSAQPAAPADRAASQRLTDFLNIPTLQEIQDGFAAVTGLAAVIVDADDSPVTRPSDDARLTERRDALRQTLLRDAGLAGFDQRFEVPIVVDGARLGAFVLTGEKLTESTEHYRGQAEQLADRFAVPGPRRQEFVDAVQKLGASRHSEAVRFAYLLADAIAEVCRQDMELRNRVQEMSTLYQVATLLAGQRDLKQVLDTVVQAVTDVMDAKAASLRLLDGEGRELIPKAAYNLSREYLDKGPILLEKSIIDQQALAGDVVYIADMATDPRVVYHDDARREGLGSILCAGMIYRGRKIGVIRVYTDADAPRAFSEFEQHLLSAIGQLAAAAIDNARLEDERREARAVQRQVKLAADVQRRMMPRSNPRFGPFDVAGRYEPCFELGGDFYDLIRFEHTLGITVGDVVGKGVAASLLMAAVRTALRAHAEDTYDLDQIMSKVNSGLTRDTLDEEFATVFYGTLDATAMRLTYSSAGHEPAYLLRDGRFTELSEGGTVLGISADSRFSKGLVDLKPGDLLLIYTDGLPDAMNFSGERFGRQRIKDAMLAVASGSAADVVNHVLWEVRRFTGLHKALDDMTLVAVKVTTDRL